MDVRDKTIVVTGTGQGLGCNMAVHLAGGGARLQSMRARDRPEASGSEASARERVWQIVALIPAGKVASYGQVAALAGVPNGARFAGSVLRDLPSGSRIPWHRVINSAGRISLPPGSASAQQQRELLLAEGVLVVNARVDLKRFAWAP